MKQKFISNVKKVPAKGRGKNNSGGATSSRSSAVVYMPSGGVTASSGGQGHTHSNKAALDSLSTDTEGYLFITRYAEILNEETGEVEVKLITEKVRAGYADTAAYADVANDLTEDSPVNKRFLSRLIDDMAEGFITFCRGLKSSARAIFGNFIAGSDGAMIDPNGDAEFNEVTARKRLTVGAPVVAGVSGGGIWVDEFGNTHLQVDFAEVTKRATFAEVEVKKLRHVGGVIILSPASMECNRVIETADSYICYFDTYPEQYPGKTIANEFRVGDLARSQTCNLVEGTSRAAANRYYWRKVISVGLDFIELSKADCDPAGVNDAPAPGDSIIQMGNDRDPQRQSLIIIAAYGSESPYIYQFRGINDYTLPDSKAKTKISPYGNRFSGEFVVETGTKNQSISDYISDLSGVYRLVAEVDEVPAERDSQGRITAIALKALCRAYRIEGGDMKQLSFNVNAPQSFGFIAAGTQLINLGGSLLTIGNSSDGEDIELLTLTYSVYRQKADSNELELHPDYQSQLYDGQSQFTLESDFAKVVFTLWRNGEKAAETAIEGTAKLNLTATRFAILDDRITSEVSNINGSISTIEQTADKIALQVKELQGVTNLLPADGVWMDSPSQVRWYMRADSSFSLNDKGTLRGHSLQTPTVRLKKDQTYTISFQVGQVHNGATAKLQGYRNIPRLGYFGIFVEGIDAVKGTNAVTFKATDDADYYFALIVSGGADDSFITFSHVMLEEGDSASSYVREASGLLPTGIDIEKRKITLRADNVQILNNAGTPTASFDADGEFCAHRVVARNEAGQVIAAMNAEGRGEYTIYYPDGKRRMQLSPSEEKDQALVYYAADGVTPLWTLGASGFSWKVEQRFVKISGYYYDDPTREANLFQFVASEQSNNFDFNGLYFVKGDVEDLTQERADGTYYAMSPEQDAAGQKRHYMKFNDGELIGHGYEYE